MGLVLFSHFVPCPALVGTDRFRDGQIDDMLLLLPFVLFIFSMLFLCGALRTPPRIATPVFFLCVCVVLIIPAVFVCVSACVSGRW